MGNGKISPTVEWLVEMMDQRFTIPGTKFRFGYDALLGLIPGLGDMIGSLISTALVLEALRQRVPWRVVARMLFNIWLDGTLGSVPVVGDVFDFYFKSNRKNLALLRKYA